MYGIFNFINAVSPMLQYYYVLLGECRITYAWLYERKIQPPRLDLHDTYYRFSPFDSEILKYISINASDSSSASKNLESISSEAV